MGKLENYSNIKSVDTTSVTVLGARSGARMTQHSHRANPKKLAMSLRSLGYSNTEAVSDIIDNSFDAGATIIKTIVNHCPSMNMEDSSIFFIDNGCGMGPNALLDALTYGTDSDHLNSDLGIFGLGLKTAATSMGKVIRVISKRKGRFSFGILDLDEVYEKNDFVVDTTSEPLSAQEAEEFVTNNGEFAEAWRRFTNEDFNSGTVVEVTRLDQITVKHPSNFSSKLKNALAKTFARKLDAACCGDEEPVEMSVNKTILTPVHLAAWLTPQEDLDKEGLFFHRCTDNWVEEEFPGSNEKFKWRFSALDSLDRSGGKRGGGTTIYRSDRILISEKPLIFRGSTQLSGVHLEISFVGNTSEDIDFDVQKSKVKLSQSLEGLLQARCKPYLKETRARRWNKEKTEKVSETAGADSKWSQRVSRGSVKLNLEGTSIVETKRNNNPKASSPSEKTKATPKGEASTNKGKGKGKLSEVYKSKHCKGLEISLEYYDDEENAATSMFKTMFDEDEQALKISLNTRHNYVNSVFNSRSEDAPEGEEVRELQVDSDLIRDFFLALAVVDERSKTGLVGSIDRSDWLAVKRQIAENLSNLSR